MSEAEASRDEATGQSTAAEPLTGRAGLEADAGFKPMPEVWKSEEPEPFANEREAAEARRERRPSHQPQEIDRSYVNYETGEKVGPEYSITLEGAASDLTTIRAIEGDSRARSVSADFAAAIDKMRADAIKNAPKAAEKLGVEPPPAEEAPAEPMKESAKSEAEAATDSGLDPEVDRALKHPQVRQALEQEFGKADAARQEFSNALKLANSFAVATFAENFPELAGLPVEQLEAGLNWLSQTNPERFNAAVSILQRVSQLQHEQQLDQGRRVQAEQQEFQTYSKSEDDRFRSMVPDWGTEKSRQVASEILPYLGELGVDRDTFLNLLQTQPIVRHAAFQKVLYDAAQFRLIQKIGSQRAARSVPAVQKPGVSSATPRADYSHIESLKQRVGGLKGDAQVRAAASVVAARRAARR